MMPNQDNRLIHWLPKGIRPIHQKYGLWICQFSRHKVTAPASPAELPFRHFEFYDLSHMFDGSGWYSSENEATRKVEKGDGILITPKTRHKYCGDKEPFVEDAISFYGPLADHLFHAGIIANGVMKIGTARRLLPIIDMVQDNSNDSQIKANLALQNLLVELYLENKKSIALGDDSPLERLLLEIKRLPNKIWDIDSMAEFCNVSPSQFKRIFIKRTGLTPKNYIDNFKMQLAAEMLSDSSKTIGDIASRLGYLDQYHFSRRFKQMKGYAPQAYREHFIRFSYRTPMPL